MSQLRQELKELHNLIGNAYCLYELSEEAFNYWLKLAGLEQESEISA